MRVQERSASSGLIEFRKITGCPPVRNAELLQEKNEVYENCVVLIVIDELKLHQRVKKKQEKMHLSPLKTTNLLASNINRKHFNIL